MLIIDRFEGDYAIVECDNGMVNIPCADLPEKAKEGDVLRLVVDTEETSVRKKHIDKMMRNIFKDSQDD